MRTLPILCFFVFSLGFLQAAEPTATPAPPPREMTTTDGPSNTTIIRNMEIAKVDGAPIYVDIAQPKVAPATPMPAILCVHGGGWAAGAAKDALQIGQATRGYFVVSVEYRLAGKALWPAQIEDSKMAVRWIRANAQKYHVNPNKIGAIGHSAGGQLVACLGTMGKSAGYEGGPFPGFSSQVQAVVDQAGPSDLLIYFKGKLTNLFSRDEKKPAEALKKASPINYVSKDAPPFLILHGDQDTAVPMEQGALFADALKKAGVPVEFVVVKNAGHSFGRAPKDAPCEPTPKEQDALIDAFFDKHLKN